MSDKKKSRRGRPKEGRSAYTIHVLPDVMAIIDSKVDPKVRDVDSRGKVIENKFKSVD